MKYRIRWSGRVFGSLLSVAMASNIVHAEQRPGLPAETGTESAGDPAIVDGHSFAGQAGTFVPPSASGAIGRFSYIQLIASRSVDGSASIYNRHTHAVIASGTLNELSGNISGAQNQDAQIIWDATTSRFYYAMTGEVGGPKISFGFSKTPNPTTISSADWCQYGSSSGFNQMKDDVDSARLGDNKDFLIIGYHHRSTSGLAARIFAVAKPPAGTTCPGAATLKSRHAGVRDASGAYVWGPVPSNQVDDEDVGYVVARNLSLPSNKLWFFTVSKDADGFPSFGPARGLTVPRYNRPPPAPQPSDDRRLDTGLAEPSPAVQAINPARGTNSFWFTQTVKHPEGRSVVRWYEVDPAPPAPVVMRSGVIGSNASETFYFNAAISPDRRKDGAIAQFGDSFVVHYNVSSSTVNPGIRAASSFQGGRLKFSNVKKGVLPDLARCSDNPSAVCQWAAYSSAAPDPRPTTVGSGAVWGTNAYWGTRNPQPGEADFPTWIFALQP